MNNPIAYIIKIIADTMANISYGNASGWGTYQPKEPTRK